MRRAPCPSFFNRGRCIVARRHTCISDKFLPNTFFIFFLKGISRVAPKLKQVVAVIPLSALRPDPRSRTEAAAGVRSTFSPPPLTHFDARTGPPSFLRRRTTGAAAVRTFVRTCLIVPCYATHGRGGRGGSCTHFPVQFSFCPIFPCRYAVFGFACFGGVMKRIPTFQAACGRKTRNLKRLLPDKHNIFLWENRKT